MLAPQTDNKTRDGYTYADACRRLEEAGADCVGLNCNFGPQTIIPAMREIRKVCKVRFFVSVFCVSHRTKSTQATI